MMRAPMSVMVPALRAQLAALGVDATDDQLLVGVIEAQRERARTLKDMAQNSLYFFRDFEHYDNNAVRKHLTAEAAPLLRQLAAEFAALPVWNAAGVHAVIDGLAQQHAISLGKVAQPLRVAVSGGAVSPPIDVTVALLGQTIVDARIQRALRERAGA
jgi:glutamyl-tRNA synthetase